MDSKKVYVWSLPLTPEVILSFVSSQVALLMQSYKEHELYVTTVIIPLVILYMNACSFVNLGLPLPLSPLNFLPAKKVWIYIETAIVVVISYVSLLIVSWSYIWLVVFPIIAIGFIVALCSELSHQDQAGGSHSQEQSNEGEGDEATAPVGKKAEGLEAVALVPYWALCMMGHFHADKFTVSQFLLFFSFMLGALTMMMTRLVGLATVHRGIAPASELLRKASLVVLLVAVHAMAAELLGENALLFCLPEIVPVLLWLSVRLDCHDGAIITGADRIKLGMDSRVVNLLGAAAAAVLAAMLAAGYMDESVLYWCGKALVSCAVSALLTLYIVFMLCQWPGGQRDGTLVTVTAASLLQEAIQLLNSWAKVLLAAVATLLVLTTLAAFQLVLLQELAASATADQILQRLGQKFLQSII
ncbi:hypothetical protein BDA96_03G166800 [Sorghum bicolor]|jgi:hypothetical protein|uniref:Uncharacterized protein n=2 Tax=Sorghum bicolor TaxID=4558 RepID=C5XJV5_SORBI|nr:uncharacterized protein LOC8075326 [Sorghum bicolor]EES00722.1 hypothetical protein SORBI_3003G157700 [Sorghum bicolor]KAG0537649.1 hypothetical protein BDA96_03G166800 [Sorghum bicolor]|eukprot:XP_002455602.1 uncharacterized protein LOC8075326 [Sorghum bicolor]